MTDVKEGSACEERAEVGGGKEAGKISNKLKLLEKEGPSGTKLSTYSSAIPSHHGDPGR